MSLSLRIRLSVMMFLQFAIWGAWLPVAAGYFDQDLGFTGAQIGRLLALMPIMCIIAPFIGGQMADRYIPTQIFMGVAHLLGGVCLLFLAPQSGFTAIVILLGAWAFFYAPTLGLINSISFHHLESPERDFGKIRFWGTFGWIVVGLVVTIWLSAGKFGNADDSQAGLAQAAEAVTTQVADVGSAETADEGMLSKILAPLAKAVHSATAGILGRDAKPQLRDIFTIAGCASILLGFFCFFLPHTPPAKKGDNPWAFLEAFKLCRDYHFVIFLLVSFAVGALMMFLFVGQFGYLKDTGITEANIPFVLTLEQVGELLPMAFLVVLLPRLGARTCLTIGLWCWPILFGVFAIAGAPMGLKVAVLALHGIGYGLFVTVSFIYVDSLAGKDFRASAQALQAVVIFGLGPFVGSELAGWAKDQCTTEAGQAAWTPFFLIPCIVLAVCGVAFVLFFKQANGNKEASEQ